MSAQIIRRHEGFQSQKERIEGKAQVSFNDWGHLAVRFIQEDDRDVLLVFDADTSARIINFCQERIKTVGRKCHWDSDIPF